MIQRRQTLYIILAIISCLISICSPIGIVESVGLGHDSILFNLGIKGNDNGIDYYVIELFVLQAITIPIGIITIFKYNNRALQRHLCVANTIILILWNIVLITILKFTLPINTTFHPKLYICLPFISIILYLIAYRHIYADEKLIKSADRIR